MNTAPSVWREEAGFSCRTSYRFGTVVETILWWNRMSHFCLHDKQQLDVATGRVLAKQNRQPFCHNLIGLLNTTDCVYMQSLILR